MKTEVFDEPVGGQRRLHRKKVLALMKNMRKSSQTLLFKNRPIFVDKLVVIMEHNGNLKDLML